MITTVTPNPSLDRTLQLPRFVPGHVNRATATMVEPSGKGVNDALALHGVGVPVRAVLPVGGSVGHEIALLLDDLGLDHVDVPIAGTPRSNISLVEADGRTSKVNEPGPQLSDGEIDALCTMALAQNGTGEWVVWAGSLPGGFTSQRFADAVAATRAAGRLVALDCSGLPLRHALAQAGGLLPHLARGVRTVLVSLGGHGALLVDADLPEPLHGAAAVRRVVNTVGAGDAFLAGWLAAVHAGGTSSDALANALRFGATAVEDEGTLLGVPDPCRPVVIGTAAQTPLTL
ncbi:MAG: 1-phosphofructokinase family hexose kinase [Mycobacterium sp.]|nr:1-phosphofructokinase family hexose kinase [Mycobacterium sp.]